MTKTEKFFLEDIPAAYKEAVEAMARKVEDAEASSVADAATLRSQFDAMMELEATLRVELSGEGGRDYYLNQKGSTLAVTEQADTAPILWISQALAEFEAVRDTGVNALSIGGSTGSSGSIKPINPSVVERVKSLDNVIKIVIEGVPDVDEATTIIRLGENTDRDDPDMTLSMALEDYKDMTAGKLLPPQAFMMGKLRIDGDMSLAMQLATLTMPGG